MRTKLKHWIANLALVFASVVVTFTVLEFGVFRTILKPDDVLPNVTIDGVVRYQPDTVAVFRHPDGRTSRVTINAQGWNSTKPQYQHERTPGRLRIAVVGDSYVQASYVDADKAFPEVIERQLRARGIDAEVLRFGMDGAPLSQYLHMLRHEVAAYQPDLVLVQLIHNDFDESFRFLKTRYASSFLKLDVDEEGRVTEFPPADFQRSIADVLRSSAMFRYLYYETNLYIAAKSWTARYFWGSKDEAYDPAFIVSAVDTRNLDDVPHMTRVARHIIAEMKNLADERGFKLALSMDGVRETIYGRHDEATRKVEALNAIAKDAADAEGVPFLDLTATFRTTHALTRQPLEYTYDWHWNAQANEIVGETLADFILTDPRLLSAHTPAAAAARASIVKTPG